MKFAFSDTLQKGADLIVLPFWEGGKPAVETLGFSVEPALKDFKGKNGETLFFYDQGERILLLGLGKQEKASIEALRRAYSAAARAAMSKKVKRLDLLFPKCKQKEEFLRGIGEGLILTNYSFSYKTEGLKENPVVLLEKVTFIGISKHPLLEKLQTIGEGVHFVRDLVNGNADRKIEQLVAASKKLHKNVKTTLFNKKRLEEEKMGLILAVGRSSSVDPCLIMAEYKGNPKSKAHIILVGKGVTYDTGGLNLKLADGMLTMKCDMAGAATVLGAVKTAAALGLKVNVTALAPVTENCIDSKSYKPGDVYTSYNGKTVEINNTDAEGRLILADALAYAVKKLNPSCMVDLATLTGACVIALGEEIGGLLTKEDDLAEALLSAADQSDELLCRLPLYEDYKEAFKSEIADLVNSGGREAGAIKAALFLQEFTGAVPWAHIDIAGPAYQAKPKHYNPMKGTGYGLRLLVEFLEGQSQ